MQESKQSNGIITGSECSSGTEGEAEETRKKNESLGSSEEQLEELENYRSHEVGYEIQPKILSESCNSPNEPNSSISLLP